MYTSKHALKKIKKIPLNGSSNLLGSRASDIKQKRKKKKKETKRQIVLERMTK